MIGLIVSIILIIIGIILYYLYRELIYMSDTTEEICGICSCMCFILGSIGTIVFLFYNFETILKLFKL